jgi:hypothetical protein
MGILDLGIKRKTETVLNDGNEIAALENQFENGNENEGAADQSLDVAEIMEGAADTVSVPEPGPMPEPGFPVEEGKRKRGRPRKNPEPPNELEAFFSPEGIGRVWVTGLNAFYMMCEAPTLSPQEEALHKASFAKVVKKWLPAESAQYQPELLLLACVAMSTLPRMNPIAKKTAPFWRRVYDRMRRKKSE